MSDLVSKSSWQDESIFNSDKRYQSQLMRLINTKTDRPISRTQVLVHSSLCSEPSTHHVGVAKRHNLTGNHTRNTLLPIHPPEQVCNSCPECSVLSTSGDSGLDGQHGTETPTLQSLLIYGQVNAVTRKQHTCATSPCGYKSPSGFECSGFASGMPLRPKSGI